MKVLILGGTGAMGKYLAELLNVRGDIVYVTSRNVYDDYENIHFLCGNAKDFQFIKKIIVKIKIDCIVDFMVYTVEEFSQRYEYFLKNTYKYIFLSSSRVYSKSNECITESSPRLLDITEDKEFIYSEDYPIAKALQEDYLFGSLQKNWVIIRPYITFSDERLQLGVYEKEFWLYRSLKGRKIIFSDKMSDKYTTLTWGKDVAKGIDEIIHSDINGMAVQITTNQAVKWNEVIELYNNVLKKVLNRKLEIYWIDDVNMISKSIGNKYPVIYDRMWDRKFDNSKFMDIVDGFDFSNSLEQLERCLYNFLKNPLKFREKPISAFAYFDKITNERTKLNEIDNKLISKDRLKYILYRYTDLYEIRVGSKL